MSVLALVMILVVLGVVATLVWRSSMVEPFKSGIFWVCVLVALVCLFDAVGVIALLRGMQVPSFSR